MAQDLGNPFERPATPRSGEQFEFEVRNRLVEQVPNTFIFRHSVVISYDGHRQVRPREVDFVVVGPSGVFLLEAKCVQSVSGQIFGDWTYAALDARGNPQQVGTRTERAGEAMRRKMAQASARIRERGRGWSDYRDVRVVFVFPDDCQIRLRNEHNQPATRHSDDFFFVRLGDLAGVLESAEPPREPQGQGQRLPPLDEQGARSLLKLFVHGSAAYPGHVGTYRILESSTLQKAPNGLSYSIHQLDHTELDARRRGKRYSWDNLEDRDRSLFEAQVRRHAEVQNAIGSHPNIHRHFEFFREDGGRAFWVVEEWIDGASLSQILSCPDERSRIDLPQLAKDMAAGLKALHDNQFICRSFRPDCVWITRETPPRAILTNFEFTKAPDGSPTVSSGATRGEDPYMAPEVVTAPSAADRRSDLYSWAAVVVAAATGPLPAGATPIVGEEFPRAAQAVLQGCLEYVKSYRPASFDDVLSALHAWK